MSLLAAGMVGSGLVSGLLGASAQRDAANAAADAQKAALAGYFYKLDQVGMPPDQSAAVILEQYKQAGILTPELEQQIKSAASEFSNIKQNKQAVEFQSQALRRMSDLGRAGLTEDERAQYRQLQADAARQAEAQQQSIIQNLAARGQGGGGAEIAARLGAAQAAAQRSSESADRISSIAAQRALQAIASGGSLAGQMEAQDFGEQAQRASAADVMNRFNIQNQMGVEQRNVASKNAAQASNLQNLQNIQNMNVSQTNQEKYNQLQRQRQNWLDKLNYAQAYSQPMQAYGQVGANQAQQIGQSQANMWQGLGQAFTGGMGYMGQQQNFDKLLAAKTPKSNEINYEN
jgi:hypothetical protein